MSIIILSMAKHKVPGAPTNAPYLPFEVEAKYYLYGLPSKPLFIVRSSPNVWMKPTDPEAFLDPIELTPLGTHRLHTELWEDCVGPAMDAYLLEKQVQWTLLHPVRINRAGGPSSAVIMIGVNPGTLSHATVTLSSFPFSLGVTSTLSLPLHHVHAMTPGFAGFQQDYLPRSQHPCVSGYLFDMQYTACTREPKRDGNLPLSRSTASIKHQH